MDSPSGPRDFIHGIVDAGIRSHRRQASARVTGSQSFTWLLALRPTEWSRIIFDGVLPEQWQAVILKSWGPTLVISSSSVLTCDVELVCLHSNLLSEFLTHRKVEPCVIQLLDTAPRRLPKSFPRLKIRHELLGGVTTSTIHFVYFRFPTAVCIADTVQRPIGSIIDHKLFPPRLDAPDSFFTLMDRLPLRELSSAFIQLPSRFQKSAFRYRKLSTKEQHLALDLPLWAMSAAIRVPTFQPLKPASAIGDFLLGQFGLSLNSLGWDPLLPLLLPKAEPKGFFLRDLGRWLPSDWIDLSLISDKAVKSDDADIPTQLWNNRIDLALDCSTNLLPPLRRLFHSVAVRRVVVSFIKFMKDKHAAAWRMWVASPAATKHCGFLWRSVRRLLRGGSVHDDPTYFTNELLGVPAGRTEFALDLVIGVNAVKQYVD